MNSGDVFCKKLRFDAPDNPNKFLELLESNKFQAINEHLKVATPIRKQDKALYVTTDVVDLIQGIALWFESKMISSVKIRKIAEEFFNGADLVVFLATYWSKNLKMFEGTSAARKNSWLFLASLAPPKSRMYAKLGSEYYPELDFTEGKRCKALESLWLKLIYRGVPQDAFLPVLRKLLNEIMDIFTDPELLGDFFVSFIQKKEFKFGIFALEGVAKLMLEKNFSYPEFYNQLYEMLPALTVLPSRESKIFVYKLDMYMSSTHIPAYSVAAFAKRIARMQLVADIEMCGLLVGVLRNMFAYHAIVREMCHREEPVYLDSDPYDETASLKDCNARESSLWEVAPIFRHYQAMIPKKVDFIEAVTKKVVMDPIPLQEFNKDEMYQKFFAKGGKRRKMIECPISHAKLSDDFLSL